MKLGSLFSAGGPKPLAKKPKPQSTPAAGAGSSALANVKPPRRRPGDFGIKWPPLPQQQVKDYKVITTKAELMEYFARCKEIGFCSFDWETAASEDTRARYAKEKQDIEIQFEMTESDTLRKILVGRQEDLRKAYLISPVDPWQADICTASISAAPHESRVIPISHRRGKVFEPDLSREDARKLFLDIMDVMILRDTTIMKIAVNLSFETKFLAKYKKYIMPPVADPFVMWVRCLQVAAPHKINDPKKPSSGWGLKPATKAIMGVEMQEFKDVLEKHNAEFFDELDASSGTGLSYSAEDADYGLQQYLYWREIAKQIPGYEKWLHEVEMPFGRVIGLMEYHGMAWDPELAEEKRKEAMEGQEAASAEIVRICKEAIGLDVSPGKTGKTNGVKHVLFNVMKLPQGKPTDAGGVALNEEALIDIKFMLENNLENLDEEKLLAVELPDNLEDLGELTEEQQEAIRIRGREPHPYKEAGLQLLEQMGKIQKYTTLLSSHVNGREKHRNPVSGRIHAQFTPWTETSRLNSLKPNGQNTPRMENDTLGVRNMYKAPAGRIYFFIDFSGFELRILAWKSWDEVLIEIFNTGGDMHKKTAASIAEKLEAEVTKKERTDAKPANFQMAYGGTEHALQKTIKTDYGKRVPIEECKRMCDGRDRAYPGVVKYKKEVVLQAREDGYSQTGLGYIRMLPDISSPNRYKRQSSERQAMNTPIQGTAADFMKAAQNTVYDQIGYGTTTEELLGMYGYNNEATAGIEGPAALSHGKTDMIAQVHDEIIFEMDDDPDVVEAAWHTIQGIMEREPIPGFPVPIEAEASVGYRWGQKIDVKEWLKMKREGK